MPRPVTEVVTNNAVAVIMTPIAVGVAQALCLDPRAFVVVVMFGASASFATPIGYQTNTMVYNAGGYRFSAEMPPISRMLAMLEPTILP